MNDHIKKDALKSIQKNEEDMIQLPLDLIKKIHTFAASTNNYLMTVSVVGDDILNSAKLMIIAGEICKELDKKNE